MSDLMREEFEDYARSIGWTDSEMSIRMDGNYEDWGVNPLWLSWKASHERMAIAFRPIFLEIEGIIASHGRDSAELRRLCQDRDDARKERDQLKAEVETLTAAAQELRDEWRKDQADAERYRWLRDKQTFIWLIQDWFPTDSEFIDVDSVIDAAMGKEVKTK